MIDGWGISCEIALRWMPLNLTDDKSTLVQVMAWCRQATSHYLSQCWPRSMSPYAITRPQWVKYLLGLTHCDLVTPYRDTNLKQHWLRYWLIAWWHQANSWTNVDLPSMKSSEIHFRLMPTLMSIPKLCFKFTHLRSQPHLPEDNELMRTINTDTSGLFYEGSSAKFSQTTIEFQQQFSWIKFNTKIGHKEIAHENFLTGSAQWVSAR